ncbi:MAG TPA: LytR C-terminal domain-containing protein [Patescibacteria group bacterium]|nr:LytR C-terminal domain-containing protein [Patescibacteria group bacterium]
MKKILIIIGIIIILVIAGWLVFANFNNSAEKDEATNQNQNVNQTLTLKPWEITVGIYDPAETPSPLTKLLESRLKEIGFKAVILSDITDPQAVNTDKTTLLYRAETEKDLAVVASELIVTNVYRRGQNQSIIEDVIIVAWNIEDINWGSFAELADKYNHPKPEDVSILILNAGAKSGSAGQLAKILGKEGHAKTKVESAETEIQESALIYYQRNYKETAKDLRKILAENGYPEATYRIDINQADNIVIKLGKQATTTAE